MKIGKWFSVLCFYAAAAAWLVFVLYLILAHCSPA